MASTKPAQTAYASTAPASTAGSYTPVPTSAALATRKVWENAAHAVESLDKATPFGTRVAGQWLAQTHVRSHYIPVLEDVYDRLALDQEAEEQACYGHLYRLALGDARNFCRVSRRELSTRTKLSDRRLGKALAGLVKKSHIALVERDRQGTLYRVRLPHEVFGEATPSAVFLVREKDRPAAAPASAPPASAPPASAPPASATPASATPSAARPAPKKDYKNSRVSGGEPKSIGEVAAAFLARTRNAYGRAEVVEEIMGRLEEGRTLAEVDAELGVFASRAAKKTPLRELERFLARQSAVDDEAT